MNFSKETKATLLKAGWYESRHIDIEKYKMTLILEGYVSNDLVNGFLTEFGGIEVTHSAFLAKGKLDTFHFDVIRAIEGVYRECVETYEQKVGESLAVVGEAYSNHLVLLMSISGKFYGAFDDVLILIGNNKFEALEALCSNKPMTV